MTARQDRRRVARPSSSTALGAVRARIAGPAPRPGATRGRSRWSRSPRPTRPRTCALVALGVAGRRREPRPRGEGQGRRGRDAAGRIRRRPRWHFVGRLQTQQVPVGRGLRRRRALPRPGRARRAPGRRRRRAPAGPPLEVFVQVSLDGDPDRGGVAGRRVRALADAVAARPAAAAARRHGRRAAGRRPRRRVRPAGRAVARAARASTRRRRDLGRDERRPRTGHQTRRRHMCVSVRRCSAVESPVVG